MLFVWFFLLTQASGRLPSHRTPQFIEKQALVYFDPQLMFNYQSLIIISFGGFGVAQTGSANVVLPLSSSDRAPSVHCASFS